MSNIIAPAFTFILTCMCFLAISAVSFANTTIPQACKKLKDTNHNCSCMSYKGIVGWIQWTHFASGVVALIVLAISTRLWAVQPNPFILRTGILWFLLVLLLLWSATVYVSATYMHNRCELYKTKGTYNQKWADDVSTANLYVMLASVVLLLIVLILNVVLKSKSDPLRNPQNENLRGQDDRYPQDQDPQEQITASQRPQESFQGPGIRPLGVFRGGAPNDWYWTLS